MSRWFRDKRGAMLAFLVVAGMVLSGLTWLTAATLKLERDGQFARAQAQEFEKLRLALWRLDSILAPALAREDSRPFHDYSDMFAPLAIFQANAGPLPPGRVFEVSPLVTDELPSWMLVHFQVGADGVWSSPQVFSDALAGRMERSLPALTLLNRTPERRELLASLSRQFPARELVAFAHAQSGQLTRQNLALLANTIEMNPNQANFPPQQAQSPVNPQYDLQLRNRSMQQSLGNSLANRKEANQASKPAPVFLNNERNDGTPMQMAKGPPESGGRVVSVQLGPMVSFWKETATGEERLFLMRTAQLENQELSQGLLLDWAQLQEILRQEVQDLFPNVSFRRISADQPPEVQPMLASLPILLEPGLDPSALERPPWSALRLGLILAWAAALIALTAVALGGWSLLDLSERRFRFVSAVTHELRTPLTTLRLYLDMLAGGIIREETKRDEYLQTLNNEADRLNRLVANVLDFSCLENQKPRLVHSRILVRDLLLETQRSWTGRCHDGRMELIVEESDLLGHVLTTDARLVQQILGNLIDNACKYCGEATDRRIRLRACSAPSDRLAIEVEDGGPGISLLERRSIFRAFQRGKRTEFLAGGVGLGLALADRWAKLLGGRLFLKSKPGVPGACFRLEIPFET
jgi:signal transduction histidine kinase